MKKFATLAFAAMMAMSTACFAAGDGSVLNKLQKPAENMIDIFNNSGVTYATVVKDFAAEAKKNFTEEVFEDLKKKVAERFGKMKEYKFVGFQRREKDDLVAYLGAFTKEKEVNLVFCFDKNGKIIDAQFSPMQAQPAPSDEKAKK